MGFSRFCSEEQTQTELDLPRIVDGRRLTNDVAALDRLLDDELVFTALDGSVVGKQADLEAHRARRLRLARMETTDVRLVRCGPTVVVSAEVDHEGTWAGMPVGGRLRYTRVWCERPGGWRVVAGHMSAVSG